MEKVRAYTDIVQSKKLAEILPPESADMGWNVFVDGTARILPINDWDLVKDGSGNVKFYHAWSLAALLDVLPKGDYKDTNLCYGGLTINDYVDEWFCSYQQPEPMVMLHTHADNPIDACVEMIEKLHEQKLL